MTRAITAATLALALGCSSDPVPAPVDASLPADASSRDVAPALDACTPASLPDDPHAAERAAFTFTAGAMPADTLGIGESERAHIPITHVVVVMQENRSFDHLYAGLAAAGVDTEAIPATYTNPDATGALVSPHHLASTCISFDPPHQWVAMHAQWNHGAMDGFVRSAAVSGHDGHDALGFYGPADIPFYHWLARTFAIADRHFCSAIAGTWTNRDFLYAGTAQSVHNTGEAPLLEVRTVFDALDDAGVRWGVYTDGTPRQDCLGWTSAHRGVARFDRFLRDLADGTLPPVAFVDPAGNDDEHPPGDVQRGEAWFHRIYRGAIASPLWSHLAVILTYDETGGLFDHVPPPVAVPPSPEFGEFDHLGMRVPLLVVSPWARRAFVSHRTHDHTSILRLIELLHGLPALTARDANADAMLDLFDFGCAPTTTAAPEPMPGTGGCVR